MEYSIVEGIRNLAELITRNASKPVSKKQSIATLYEKILTYDTAQESSDDEEFQIPFATSTYILRRHNRRDDADAVEAAFENLHHMAGSNKQHVVSVCRFLAALADFKFDTKRKSDFICGDALKERDVFNYDRSCQTIVFKPVANVRFPVLPAPTGTMLFLDTAQYVQEDEGFEDISPSCSKSADSAPISENQRRGGKSCQSKYVFISDRSVSDFRELYWKRVVHPLQLLTNKATEALTLVPFSEIERCIQWLLFDCSSKISPRIDSGMFELNASVSVEMMSSGLLRRYMNEFLKLGNSINKIETYIKELKGLEMDKNFPILSAYQLGLQEMLLAFISETVLMVNGSCGAVRMLSIYSARNVDIEMSSMLSDKVLKRCKANIFTAKWLLDTLLAVCTNLSLSSLRSSFLCLLFNRTFNAYAQLLKLWLEDAVIGKQTFAEMFIDVNSEALCCEDRRFWTDALTLKTDRMPIIASSFATQVLWITKIRLLMKKLKINLPVKEDDDAKFSICNKITSTDKPYKTTLELTEDLELLCKNEYSLTFEIASAVLPERLKLLEICECLRSVFLFGDGCFTSTLADHVFPYLIDAVGVKTNAFEEWSDPFLLGSALDTAILASKVTERAQRLNFSFLIEKSDSTVGYFASIDRLKLQCVVPWPSNIVLGDLEWYQKAFSLLLKLEFVFWILTNARNRMLALPQWCTHRSLIELWEVDLFVRNIRQYLLHQVVEVSWQKFISDIPSIRADEIFDGFYHIHNEFVADFINRCLLSPKAEKLLRLVEKLLAGAADFGMAILNMEKQYPHNIGKSILGVAKLHAQFCKRLDLFFRSKQLVPFVFA